VIIKVLGTIVALVLLFGWPVVLGYAFYNRKKLLSNLKWIICLALLMPLIGIVLYGAIHGDSSGKAKRIAKQMEFDQRMREEKFRPGDSVPLKYVPTFHNFYGGKEVRVRGSISNQDSIVVIKDEACGGYSHLKVRISEDTIGKELKGNVEILGVVDVGDKDYINAKSLIKIDVLKSTDCN
jgi:hypothetical protein